MAEAKHVTCTCIVTEIEEEKDEASEPTEKSSEIPDWGKAALVIGAALLFGVAA